MIRSLSISHLGPHVATRLALPVGASEDGKTRPVPCTIRGPSMAGKSTISDAVTMALWGCDTFGSSMSLDALSGERGEVVLTLSSGTRVRRALSRRV
ncbi:MAG: hypothetical protein GY913_00045, partial [Proteobacteria bacterium]|nr:hypothetical protein [Pseudomonadota bacterium]